MWRGVLVFAVTYVLVASRRLRFVEIDRPAGALVGAVLAVALGAITPDEAAQAVDHTTIVLLFAVMGMGAFLSLDGFFDRVGRKIATRAKTASRLVGATVWGAGLLSAVVTNDAVCVLVAPLVVAWIDEYRLPRLPLLLALATGANTGSVATLVGNPQNMLCGSLGQLHFAPFALHMIPVAIVGLAINHAVLVVAFRRELAIHLVLAGPSAGAVAEGSVSAGSAGAGSTEGGEARADAPIFSTRSVVTLTVIAGTVVIYALGAPLAFTALGGFVLLLLLHRTKPENVWSRIDWSVLLFFGGLFIAVDALARSGAASVAFAHFPLVGHGGGAAGWFRASTIFLVGSNVVTNVPFILIVKPEMANVANKTLAWELLAMASTFAGNLTLLGSVANVIVAEKAGRIGGLRFGEYLRIGAPVAILTTVAGTAILVAIHTLG